ncbi:hypothetical protein E4U50_001489 [Claviceps purpurea]|nr:hypothetical protein E4U11_006492 [Claviceps purpurea]KAG6213159.1 hypothetical protein E4U50_001489 [Claviceps purpurea]
MQLASSSIARFSNGQPSQPSPARLFVQTKQRQHRLQYHRNFPYRMYAHASAGATDQSIGPKSPGTPRGTTAELGSQSQEEIGIGQMEFKVWSLGGRAEQDTSDVLIRRAVASTGG